MLVTHLLATCGQRHSVRKNECEDRVYLFAQYIVTNIIVEIEYYFYISL
jgi:hypothetical protein